MIDYQKLFRPLTKEEQEKLKPHMERWAKDFREILDHYNELKTTKQIKNIHYKENCDETTRT